MLDRPLPWPILLGWVAVRQFVFVVRREPSWQVEVIPAWEPNGARIVALASKADAIRRVDREAVAVEHLRPVTSSAAAGWAVLVLIGATVVARYVAPESWLAAAFTALAVGVDLGRRAVVGGARAKALGVRAGWPTWPSGGGVVERSLRHTRGCDG